MGIIHHLHPSNLPPRPMMQPAQLNLRKYKPNLADRSVSERHRRAIWGDLTTHNFMSLASSRFRKRSRPGGWCSDSQPLLAPPWEVDAAQPLEKRFSLTLQNFPFSSSCSPSHHLQMTERRSKLSF